jgi:hypothetical protein
LFDVAAAGVLAECFVGPRIDADLYRQIVRRKAVAYNMILCKPFLVGVNPDIRVRLLSVLGAMDELAQILNDYNDWHEDEMGHHMNAMTHGVFDERSLAEEIFSRTERFWSATSVLPPECRDAVAAMYENLGVSNSLDRALSCGS